MTVPIKHKTALILLCGSLLAAPAIAAAQAFPFVDAHVHIDENDPAGSVALLANSLGALKEAHVIVQVLPYGPGDPAIWDLEKIQSAIKSHPGVLAMTGGGGTLNPMLVEAYAKGDTSPATRAKLRARAEEILRLGAVGFGEMSNEHFVLPGGSVPDYEYYPADFPLMLDLADIAAAHDVPIDMHMEAVPADMPSGLPAPNAPMLHANFKALENLLAHNPKAKIIWAHAGSDNSGFRTPDRMRPLLKAHANLYMEIKADPVANGKNYPLDAGGKLKPEWLALFAEFPDRFIIGSDQHYDPVSITTLKRANTELLLLSQLPQALRQKIAVDNPVRLYNLKP